MWGAGEEDGTTLKAQAKTKIAVHLDEVSEPAWPRLPTPQHPLSLRMQRKGDGAGMWYGLEASIGRVLVA